MRRAILWLILAGIVGGTAWTFFEWLKPASKTADPWSAVPSESAVILELTGGREAWTGFTGVSQIWGAVSDRKGALALDSLVARVLRSVTLPSAAKPPLFALLRRGESTGWLGVIAGPSDDREAPAVFSRTRGLYGFICRSFPSYSCRGFSFPLSGAAYPM